MPNRKRKRDRVYWRNRSGISRAWADFRDYRDVGGRQEPLVAPGEGMATTDPDVAQMLVAARIRELDAARRGRGLHGCVQDTPLAAYAAEHLVKKAQSGRVTRAWLDVISVFLQRAVSYFGAGRDLASIGVVDVQRWATHLATTPYRPRTAKPGVKGRTLSSGTVRHALNALSNLYRRAASEGRVPSGFNPVSSLMDKPSGRRLEAQWLEVHEAALLLESARTLPSVSVQNLKKSVPTATIHALLATFVLTGGRRAEVLGLEVDDISFDRKTVTFRPNAFRRLKTLQSARVVPLWPQLEEILRPYIFSRPPARLLFPSFLTGTESMLVEWRRALDRVSVRAGWKLGEIRSRIFRHSYCAARLQTLDAGAPVSPFTVSRELGHGSRAMVEQVYSHLGLVRHRSEVVEFRLEQHRTALRERLEQLGWTDIPPVETRVSADL
jgi:integrase